jgi:hypothetical protein
MRAPTRADRTGKPARAIGQGVSAARFPRVEGRFTEAREVWPRPGARLLPRCAGAGLEHLPLHSGTAARSAVP